jgi:hypothetical protein
MNTTNKPPEWGKWGDGKKEPKMKEYLELLLKFNTQAIEVLKEGKRNLEEKVKEQGKNGSN